MFFFSTPSSSGEAAPRNPVLDAIRDGSRRTGAGFDYLVKTAQRESSLAPDARNPRSSASGLFQFIEQTWLGTMKKSGPAHGLSDYADAIREVRPGRYDVPDPAMKQRILGLRNDPAVASVMAGEFTRQNASQLGAAIGRQPTEGELYAAHFMGPAGAGDLIRRVQTQPAARAADLYPDQAQANRSIFFDQAGRARSVREVYDALTADRSQAIAVPAVPVTGSDPSSWFMRNVMSGPAGRNGRAMDALFRTEGDRGPVSKAVARLWTGGTMAAASPSAPAFFPRTASLAPDIGTVPAQSPTAALQPAAVPLPPERPASVAAPHGGRDGRHAAPLNLLQFAKRRIGA
jgi:hypothetical protein